MVPREYPAVGFAVSIFFLVQLGALALVPGFFESGYQAVENPDDPAISILYLGVILVATALMLAAFKYNLDRVVRGFVLFAGGMLAWYVFSVLVPPVFALIPAVLVVLGLLYHPEWYVIDVTGIVMGAGAAGLFGISFGLLPCILLLSALAVYDAISVYGTEHMLSLAEGVMELRIPVILVVPLSLSYSLLEDDFAGPEGNGDDGSDSEGSDGMKDESPQRDAFFIGLGDAVMPAIMVASAAFFSPAPNYEVPIIAVNLPAIGAMVGTILGLLVLLRWVMRGRAHAGLPLLNGGAIGGYLLGSLAAGVTLAEAVGVAGFF
ncbi:Presenilin-like membrane protease, A22 family [Halalkaliarchaeum sp. AArc-CO]|uniref:presenilin family intramembrane aspartyl protease PSH n=1 Tax=unclassified Halalkaliarchaeum TaxID=2678344 RepID=UPI00217E6E62|nr:MULTISPECIES: presenilin family intramembrane aspartyl protease PSH [unclassified Halalkaliarchaeum]MDR5672476.1 presenilin family intramembrane aspartyl protease PSH [Halalkaliarchaeum sp. AArc-GB]UWG50574.1 Presenilin-like membrane protease, A22 family [Halalkaliarchaeum sp. AArc-CO]